MSRAIHPERGGHIFSLILSATRALPEARCLGPGSVSNASASQAQGRHLALPCCILGALPVSHPDFPSGCFHPHSSLSTPHAHWKPGEHKPPQYRLTRRLTEQQSPWCCPCVTYTSGRAQQSQHRLSSSRARCRTDAAQHRRPRVCRTRPRAARLIITFQAPRLAQHEREYWEHTAHQPVSSIAQALVIGRSPAISCDAPAPFSLACGVSSSTPGYLACCLGDRSESEEDASSASQHWQAPSPMHFRMPCDGALSSQMHCMPCQGVCTALYLQK